MTIEISTGVAETKKHSVRVLFQRIRGKGSSLRGDFVRVHPSPIGFFDLGPVEFSEKYRVIKEYRHRAK